MNCDCLTIHLFLVEEMWIAEYNPLIMLFEELGCPILQTLNAVNKYTSNRKIPYTQLPCYNVGLNALVRCGLQGVNFSYHSFGPPK